MFTQILIRIARAVVQNVLSQLMKQLNVIQEQAQRPMQEMVQQVTGGIWVGRGADAFVEEVSNLMIPGVGKVGQGITTYHKNIQNAMDVMDQADQVVSGIANAIGDIFGGIF
jgi:NADH/NAD ratio-sensing transcriptional regulator Rex